MSKRVLRAFLIGSALTSCQTNSAYAQSAPVSGANICSNAAILVGYFNGVGKTRLQADGQAAALNGVFGSVDQNGDRIEYQLFYNYSSGTALGYLDDVREVFDQRLRELPEAAQQSLSGRYELLWEAATQGGSFTDTLSAAVPALTETIKTFVNSIAAVVTSALLKAESTSITFSDYARQRELVDSAIDEGQKIVFFAHSQGNLYANRAYSYAIGKTTSSSLKVIHVAPASAVLNGPYKLGTNDLVINGLLRLGGSVPVANVDTPPTLSSPDASGHGLFEIYLNPTLKPLPLIRNDFNDALSSMETPPSLVNQGLFTVTLEWNGSGDVDLHTFEPNGKHVYYSSKQGTSGYLDVDNTSANGPEHYYAACNADTIQTGIYKIGINNYARAEGRTASVLIKSNSRGQLTRRTLSVGPVRGNAGNNSPIPVANVVVSRNSETGRYTVEAN